MKKIEFGICASPSESAICKAAGFDYIEGNVQGDLVPHLSDSEFQSHYDALLGSRLPIKCANCFLPENLKVTGPDADLPRIWEYAEIAFSRAQSVGIDTIVFGSGGARQVPQGFSEVIAAEQIRKFVKGLAPLTRKHDITLVIEPLCDCNVLNSVAEGAALVNAIRCSKIRLLADFYHWDNACDRNIRALTWSVPLLKHIHVATTPSRNQPGTETCDIPLFFKILKDSGYQGRISFEGHWKDQPDKEKNCLQAMHAIWKGA